MNEIQELKKRAMEADLSVKNPKIQQIFENELARWVNNYQINKEKKCIRYDCYGGPGDIPDKIQIAGGTYSPPEILSHVKARDETGMEILRQMQRYRDGHKLFGRIQLSAVESIKDDASLDKVVLQCVCGCHNITNRGVLEGIINADSELIFLTVGLPYSIMKLYGKDDEAEYDERRKAEEK